MTLVEDIAPSTLMAGTGLTRENRSTVASAHNILDRIDDFTMIGRGGK